MAVAHHFIYFASIFYVLYLFSTFFVQNILSSSSCHLTHSIGVSSVVIGLLALAVTVTANYYFFRL